MRKRFFIFAILVMICSITIGQTKYSQELVNKAEAGNAEAQYNLGLCYKNGYGVSRDHVKAVYWFDVPNHVLTIPSVIPMIPGVLMYRSLLAFINMHGVVGEVTHAFYNGINSALIIFCISLGVAVPNIFARRYIAKDRHKLLEQELQKRRERGKFIEW